MWKFQSLTDGKKHGLSENPPCPRYKSRGGSQQLFTPLFSLQGGTATGSNSCLFSSEGYFGDFGLSLSTEQWPFCRETMQSCWLLWLRLAWSSIKVSNFCRMCNAVCSKTLLACICFYFLECISGRTAFLLLTCLKTFPCSSNLDRTLCMSQGPGSQRQNIRFPSP